MKRPEPHIDRLIARQIDGASLTGAERRQLREWLEASAENRRTFFEAYRAWGDARLPDVHFDTDRALENLLSRIDTAPAPRRTFGLPLRRLAIGIAAAACVAVAVTGYYGLRPATDSAIEVFVRQAEAPVFTQKEVRLTLSEQRTLLLDTDKSTIRYDSTTIRINDAEKTIPKKEAAAFNQLVVPYGKQTTLTLADGTRVWVNAGSRLVYPVVFEKRRREIHVEGEVYMEVAHDAERPFTVHTGKLDVSVLGTKFYVSSYGREQTHEVVLVAGSVSVAPTGHADRGRRIVPGQQALLDASDKLEINEVEAENYIGWIHGYLPFDNERLEHVLDRLARYYDCRIACTPRAAALTLSGKLELKADPAEVLKVLSDTAPITLQTTDSGEFRIDCRPTANPQTKLPM